MDFGQPDSTAAGGIPVGHVGAGNKRNGGRPPPLAQPGTPTGVRSRRSSKRARVDVKALVAATSAEAAAGDDGPNPSVDEYYSEPDGDGVKTEVGVLTKVDPQAKRSAESMDDERAASAEFGLGPEPDASVKAEVVVSLPSKRQRQLEVSGRQWLMLCAGLAKPGCTCVYVCASFCNNELFMQP